MALHVMRKLFTLTLTRIDANCDISVYINIMFLPVYIWMHENCFLKLTQSIQAMVNKCWKHLLLEMPVYTKQVSTSAFCSLGLKLSGTFFSFSFLICPTPDEICMEVERQVVFQRNAH